MIKRFARDQRGAAAVEFALIGLVLFGLVCGAIELALILFTQSSLENAARVASRFGITGQAGTGNTRDASILNMVKQNMPGLVDKTKLTLNMLEYNDFSDVGDPEPWQEDKIANGVYDPGESYTDVNGNGKWDADQGKAGAGNQRALVLYKVTYPWSPQFGITTLFHLTPINLSARIIIRNEPFPALP